jgi:intracellular multiplication protein IcmL
VEEEEEEMVPVEEEEEEEEMLEEVEEEGEEMEEEELEEEAKAMKTMKTMKTLENVKNVKNVENVENVENVKNMKNSLRPDYAVNYATSEVYASADIQGVVLPGKADVSPLDIHSDPLVESPASIQLEPPAHDQLEAKAGHKPDIPYGAEIVIESRQWYKSQSGALLKIMTVMSLCCLLSLVFNFYQFFSEPEPKYFGLTRDLRILEMPPLSEPVVDGQTISNWVTDVVTRSLSLNFLHFRQTLSEVKPEFDPAGFESFLKSLDSGGHLKKIEQERLSLSCVIGGAPVITSSVVKRGVMTWTIELPLTLSYESSSGVIANQKLLAEVLVQRTKTSLNPRGIVIRQLLLTKAA